MQLLQETSLARYYSTVYVDCLSHVDTTCLHCLTAILCRQLVQLSYVKLRRV